MEHRVFDAHFHIIDPAFPLVPNNGYLPERFTVDDYRARTQALGVAGGAVVSGSFQAFDSGYLLAALPALGPGFVGVVQLSAAASDEKILRLAACGVRAVRFNVRRGGSESLDQLEPLAKRVHELAGWHTEMYVAASLLHELMPVLLRLPALSIDHLGLTREGQSDLLRLVDSGAHVKADGFGRLDAPPGELLQAIYAVNPQALMFATDLPSTRAPRPFDESDLDLIGEALGDDAAEAVFWRNAREFYRV